MSKLRQKSVSHLKMEWVGEGVEAVQEEWLLHFAECHSSSKYQS